MLANATQGICYTYVVLCCSAHGCCAVECSVTYCAVQYTAIATLTSILNHTAHRFVAHSTRYCGYRATFAHFHLTAISQHGHYASVQINGQVVLFKQLCRNKTMAGATVKQS